MMVSSSFTTTNKIQTRSASFFQRSNKILPRRNGLLIASLHKERTAVSYLCSSPVVRRPSSSSVVVSNIINACNKYVNKEIVLSCHMARPPNNGFIKFYKNKQEFDKICQLLLKIKQDLIRRNGLLIVSFQKEGAAMSYRCSSLVVRRHRPSSVVCCPPSSHKRKQRS